MKINREEIKNIALLSRLEVPEERMAQMEKALNDVLQYVEELEELDLTDVEPMAHAVQVQNVFRKDEVKPSLDRKLALQNAPEEDNGYFKVPRVIQE
ncbi:Asp-tRNA(Asn)/Glu-tRNA(Gln) amidotransferase subunit GatC [Veillonella magna]|uniref:Aspartyl/glutamyl-tRNA(Asn/Gln) amidotransferase subunit C n=1 Tax=Veillonella magna TaxID=464322 RepID=A0ABS2GGR8_9FIRM|nr:Asp-tRNA(Asn)/Glu-tRNA(Gln) amidotransferase subunit GatC [Veillonella magna]MBD8975700.1 Asp-tRNA(Asn)/Glu-tRNA(Gln) amidotransferase subunit GatC [Veillonella magna]MBM6824155.1 Asp-tRNA(Asn)/Glu-tRNA(Gln) amidotransferase subunit GatC [Veillonella magna]MBM6912448.1 Asp-tRNA(Asn)/Glu-tRNA(Gln) amidotransferase subunit GatC [Veillonella magna]